MTEPRYTPLPADRRVRFGVLATGNIAATVTADMLALRDEIEVVACASRKLATAQAFAAKHGIRHAFASYDELAACDEVDVVYIATPHSHHFEAARLCIEAGKHVLCEKPLTPVPEATEKLIELAEAHDRFLMEAVWMRCNPVIRHAAQLIAAGAIGPVVRASANFDISWSGDDSNRMVNPELAGGGILDLGIYPIHALHLMLGQADFVAGAGRLYPTGVDSHAEALLSWPGPNGPTIGHASCSIEGETPMVLQLVGESGRIEVADFMCPSEMRLVPREGEPEVFRTHVPGNGYTFELHEVVSCLRLGAVESSLVPWQSTRQVARTLDAWRQALGVKAAPWAQVE